MFRITFIISTFGYLAHIHIFNSSGTIKQEAIDIAFVYIMKCFSGVRKLLQSNIITHLVFRTVSQRTNASTYGQDVKPPMYYLLHKMLFY